MGHGVGLDKLGKRIQRLAHEGVGGVYGNGAVELSRGLVHHIELGVAKQGGAIGRQHTTAQVELGHGPAEFFRGFLRILHRQEGDPVQLAVTRLAQLVGHPTIIVSGNRNGMIRVIHHAQEQPHRGIQDGRVQSAHVQGFQPGLTVVPRPFEQFVAEIPVNAIVGGQRKRTAHPGAIPPGRFQIVKNVALALHHMPIAIDCT